MTSTAEKYAEGLFKTSESLGCTQVVASELLAVKELFKQCAVYLKNPLADASEKTSLLQELLSDKLTPLTLEFILLMLQRRQLKRMFSAMELFCQMSDRSVGKVTVELRIFSEPEPKMLKRLSKFLADKGLIPAKSTGKAQFQVVCDKGIMGGFVARCNGYQIDTSLKTALRKLARSQYLGKSS